MQHCLKDFPGLIKPLTAISCIGLFPFGLMSCGLSKPEEPMKAPIVMYEWNDTEESAPLNIEINLKE